MDDDDEGWQHLRPSDYFPANSCWPPLLPPLEPHHELAYFKDDDSILGEFRWNLHTEDHREYRLGDLDPFGDGRRPSSSGLFPIPIRAGGEAVATRSTAATGTTSNQSEESGEEHLEEEKDEDKPSPEIA